MARTVFCGSPLLVFTTSKRYWATTIKGVMQSKKTKIEAGPKTLLGNEPKGKLGWNAAPDRRPSDASRNKSAALTLQYFLSEDKTLKRAHDNIDGYIAQEL